MVTLKSKLIGKKNISNATSSGHWVDSRYIKFEDLESGNILYDEGKDNTYIITQKEIAEKFLNLKFSSDFPELVFVVFDENAHFKQFSNPNVWKQNWPMGLYNKRKIDKVFTNAMRFNSEMALIQYMVNFVPKVLKEL